MRGDERAIKKLDKAIEILQRLQEYSLATYPKAGIMVIIGEGLTSHTPLEFKYPQVVDTVERMLRQVEAFILEVLSDSAEIRRRAEKVYQAISQRPRGNTIDTTNEGAVARLFILNGRIKDALDTSKELLAVPFEQVVIKYVGGHSSYYSSHDTLEMLMRGQTKENREFFNRDMAAELMYEFDELYKRLKEIRADISVLRETEESLAYYQNSLRNE